MVQKAHTFCVFSVLTRCVRLAHTRCMTIRTSLFDRFGGVRPMATALGMSPFTVAGWKRRRRISSKQQGHVLDTARKLGMQLQAEDVMFPFPEDRVPA